MTVGAGHKVKRFVDSSTFGPKETAACLLSINTAVFLSLLAGGLKCPVCNFVYGTKWEFNRHLKNKHGLKVVEIDEDPKLEVTL